MDNTLDLDWLWGLFGTLVIVGTLLLGLSALEKAGDRSAYLACQHAGVEADRELTYMFGFQTDRAICVTQDETQVDMTDWKELND